jgi:hypothetical protein
MLITLTMLTILIMIKLKIKCQNQKKLWFWNLKKSVRIWYGFASILQYFCSYLVRILPFCTYMLVSMRLTLLRALNTNIY